MKTKLNIDVPNRPFQTKKSAAPNKNETDPKKKTSENNKNDMQCEKKNRETVNNNRPRNNYMSANGIAKHQSPAITM